MDPEHFGGMAVHFLVLLALPLLLVMCSIFFMLYARANTTPGKHIYFQYVFCIAGCVCGSAIVVIFLAIGFAYMMSGGKLEALYQDIPTYWKVYGPVMWYQVAPLVAQIFLYVEYKK